MTTGTVLFNPNLTLVTAVEGAQKPEFGAPATS